MEDVVSQLLDAESAHRIQELVFTRASSEERGELLAVTHLPIDVDEEALKESFASHGTVVAFELNHHHSIVPPRASALVLYMDEDAAMLARATLDGALFDGERIRVSFARKLPSNSTAAETEAHPMETFFTAAKPPARADTESEGDDGDILAELAQEYAENEQEVLAGMEAELSSMSLELLRRLATSAQFLFAPPNPKAYLVSPPVSPPAGWCGFADHPPNKITYMDLEPVDLNDEGDTRHRLLLLPGGSDKPAIVVGEVL